MSEKNRFTKREWILFITILLIVEGFIFWVSFQFSGNSSALGYVSFAGTLISIILAVLAIGYTYGESQQQKNSSSTLANQIESLVAIKDKLEIQAEALNNINVLKLTLDEFAKNVYGQLENSKKGFEDFKKNFGTSNKDIQSSALKNTDASVTKLFNAASPFIKISLILLIMFIANKKDKEDKKVGGSVSELYNFLISLNLEGLSNDDEHSIFGGMATWFQVLNRIDELSIDNCYVSPELIKIFKDYLNNPSEDFLQSFNGVEKSLIKMAKKTSYYSENSNS